MSFGRKINYIKQRHKLGKNKHLSNDLAPVKWFLSDDVIIYVTSLVEYDVTSGPGRSNIFSKVAKICCNINFRKSQLVWEQNNKLSGISEHFREIGGHFDPPRLRRVQKAQTW